MSLVSILLTSYNRPEWLPEAIDSVINQTIDDWQLVILDDNSSDPAVAAIIHSYDDKRITTYVSNISEEDRFTTTARYATLINHGVREFSTGKYLCFLGDDDFYYPDKLKLMTDYAEKIQQHVVYCSQQTINGAGDHLGIRFANTILACAGGVVDHNSVMTTRIAFDRAGGWDDSRRHWMHADLIYWARLQAAGYQFYPLDTEVPQDAKRYHVDSVQWKLHHHRFPENTWPPS